MIFHWTFLLSSQFRFGPAACPGIVVEIQTDLRALWEEWENRGQVQLRDIHRFAGITIIMEEQRCFFLNFARNKSFDAELTEKGSLHVHNC